ncbi:hypothetical protein E2C01_066804 [Portunus trituberculatus]|uniref:Uncharacterized protein n=1 Tax=Portunus trituberculatus TaxID=210409 RepID=A0A5B7HRY2_PORTR|nr:hypothetical protein [Portunus trituberculatus]
MVINIRWVTLREEVPRTPFPPPSYLALISLHVTIAIRETSARGHLTLHGQSTEVAGSSRAAASCPLPLSFPLPASLPPGHTIHFLLHIPEQVDRGWWILTLHLYGIFQACITQALHTYSSPYTSSRLRPTALRSSFSIFPFFFPLHPVALVGNGTLMGRNSTIKLQGRRE